MKLLESIIHKLDKAMANIKQNNPEKDYINGSIVHGKHHIIFSVHKDGYKEVRVDHIEKPSWCENVEGWLERNLLDFKDIQVEDEGNEWDSNGFRNEADYITYKYC